jgi:hypothetical protein
MYFVFRTHLLPAAMDAHRDKRKRVGSRYIRDVLWWIRVSFVGFVGLWLIHSKNQAPIGPSTPATLLGISRRWRTQKKGGLGSCSPGPGTGEPLGAKQRIMEPISLGVNWKILYCRTVLWNPQGRAKKKEIIEIFWNIFIIIIFFLALPFGNFDLLILRIVPFLFYIY